MVKLDKIYQELSNIRHRLDIIESMFSNWRPQPISIPESRLLSLPDNLRKTYLVVASLGECTATEVANLTGRSRAIESSYLNQLVRMGWLAKRRNSKTLNFRVLASEIRTQPLEVLNGTRSIQRDSAVIW
jgi:DNA-binding MarR family transcriptional regulator